MAQIDVPSVLRSIRAALNLTQEQLAEKADLDLRLLQRVESGKNNSTIAVLVALANALEIPPGALLNETELPPPQYGRPKKELARTLAEDDAKYAKSEKKPDEH